MGDPRPDAGPQNRFSMALTEVSLRVGMTLCLTCLRGPQTGPRPATIYLQPPDGVDPINQDHPTGRSAGRLHPGWGRTSCVGGCAVSSGFQSDHPSLLSSSPLSSICGYFWFQKNKIAMAKMLNLRLQNASPQTNG